MRASLLPAASAEKVVSLPFSASAMDCLARLSGPAVSKISSACDGRGVQLQLVGAAHRLQVAAGGGGQVARQLSRGQAAERAQGQQQHDQQAECDAQAGADLQVHQQIHFGESLAPRAAPAMNGNFTSGFSAAAAPT
jgi:hypothetical protein